MDGTMGTESIVVQHVYHIRFSSHYPFSPLSDELEGVIFAYLFSSINHHRRCRLSCFCRTKTCFCFVVFSEEMLWNKQRQQKHPHR